MTVVVAGARHHIYGAVNRTGLTAPVLVDVRQKGAPTTLRTRFGIDQVPWTVVLDREGRGVQVIVGGKTRSAFERALDRVDKK